MSPVMWAVASASASFSSDDLLSHNVVFVTIFITTDRIARSNISAVISLQSKVLVTSSAISDLSDIATIIVFIFLSSWFRSWLWLHNLLSSDFLSHDLDLLFSRRQNNRSRLRRFLHNNLLRFRRSLSNNDRRWRRLRTIIVLRLC